ncbi:NUDIX domain-containing protein [Williamsia sp.]|uniref:NUDIX hydrolase n=1 Tax=Williamsia sp. TaxID=1872085 RepID=UPI001A27DBEA|nr:NUDIX domain-containing protein [Williamsia sp.]MBJ7291027.1 NUDIX domain-containing protein [Williamsia sp.]
MASSIRPIAVALIRRRSDGALLVTGHGLDTDDPRVRPLGGGIEFGESARTALDREIAEEIGESVARAEHLATVENIFVVDGTLGHEIVFVFDAELTDTSIEERDHFPVLDAPEEIVFWWRPGDESARLVPPALDEFVSATA